MEPRLVAISGPRKGQTFEFISQTEYTIGRDCEWLLLSDPSVSRKHCAISIDQGSFKLIDLESRNGTFVNGIPIKERILKDGDRIEIGNSLFVFLTEADSNYEGSIVTRITDSESLIRSTVRVRLEDVIDLPEDQLDIAVLPAGKLARSLQAFVKISNTIAVSRNLESLQTELLRTIFEFVPAERGAILIATEDLCEFHSIFATHKNKDFQEPVQLNRSLALNVLKEDSALLSNDVEQISGHSVSSILCAPLIALKRHVGVLYLDTSDKNSQFNSDHLKLISTIAGIAAVAIENCRYMEGLQSENEQLRADLNLKHSMIGESSAMKNVFDFISRVAPSDSTVLITGETGTGKELVARAIHQNSKRKEKPFLAINCATLSETLLESELFGHEKGSFTGAISQKKGKLEVAHGGTVFLDEIAEIAPSLQAKLLRVLQEREFERVGGTVPIKVSIRLIAATNKNLTQAVQQGSFRQDLYYRLNVLHLPMPALRERIEDIPLLASHFAAKHSARTDGRIVGLSPEARRYLICYRWPGNVRELENAIERALVLGAVNVILPEDLPEVIVESQPANVQLSRYQDAVKEAKRQLILRAMEQAKGNYVEAANILEIHPNNLHRLIRDLDLKSSLKT